jgi:hypothetical protein
MTRENQPQNIALPKARVKWLVVALFTRLCEAVPRAYYSEPSSVPLFNTHLDRRINLLKIV